MSSICAILLGYVESPSSVKMGFQQNCSGRLFTIVTLPWSLQDFILIILHVAARSRAFVQLIEKKDEIPKLQKTTDYPQADYIYICMYLIYIYIYICMYVFNLLIYIYVCIYAPQTRVVVNHGTSQPSYHFKGGLTRSRDHRLAGFGGMVDGIMCATVLGLPYI